jgi:hypothetical protein
MIDFGNNILEWDSIVIPMTDVQASNRLKSILDAKYEKADLEQVAKEAIHLKDAQQKQLHSMLKEFPKLFDRSLGKWPMGAYAKQE